MADIKVPEYNIPQVTIIEDDDVIRIVLANNASRSIKKTDFFQGIATLNDIADFLTENEIDAKLANYVLISNYEPYNGNVTEITQESDIAEVGVFDTNKVGVKIDYNTFKSFMTLAKWGSISGTLANQTDLQNALNAKANKNISTLYYELSETSLSYIIETDANPHSISLALRGKKKDGLDVIGDTIKVEVKWGEIFIYEVDPTSEMILVCSAKFDNIELDIDGGYANISGISADLAYPPAAFITINTDNITINKAGHFKIETTLSAKISETVDKTFWNNELYVLSLYGYKDTNIIKGKSFYLPILREVDLS